MNYYNYFTEIEDHFVRRRGKHLMVSPLDWSLIATWRDSGVPLHIALRGIDIAMDKFFSGRRRESERPGTLFYCHDSVMAEYAGYLEAHLGEAAPTTDTSATTTKFESVLVAEAQEVPDKARIREFLDAKIFEIKDGRAKHSLGESASEGLERILSRLEELAKSVTSGSEIRLEALERDLGILEELLVEELRAEISPEEMLEWEREATKELKVYRKRLPKETYEKIRENFVRGKIHRRFNLGELSLFQL